MKKPVTIYKPDAKTGKIRTVQLSWFSRLEYVSSDDHSAVVLRFGQDVAPYLYELKESFTKLNFANIAKLDTPFSVRLYGWLIKAKNLYGRRPGKAIEVTLDLNWMREKAGLAGKYEDYRDFRQKLLEPTINRINANTDISVVWEPVKSGRTVVSIKFAYMDESTPEATKPMRPRLPRRPRAVAGSQLEGEWARRCIAIFEDYRIKLANYDADEKSAVPDLRKLAGWYKIIGDKNKQKEVMAEVGSRSKKVAAK